MNITKQILAETERTNLIADIIQRNEDLEQFSYIVSHNLRAPIANIKGLTEILKSSALAESCYENSFMTELDASVKQLDNVIMDLDYILQVKQKKNKKKELVRFSTLLEEIKLNIDDLIRSNDVQIISHFSAIDEIYTLKSYLYSIFLNLVSNSIKYRQPEINPIIKITSTRYDNKIKILFKDNGLGINLQKRRGQVFGLYKRFHDHVDGKGMGLYLVKTQVELLGGKIAISSKINKGTEFRIEFGIN